MKTAEGFFLPLPVYVLFRNSDLPWYLHKSRKKSYESTRCGYMEYYNFNLLRMQHQWA